MGEHQLLSKSNIDAKRVFERVKQVLNIDVLRYEWVDETLGELVVFQGGKAYGFWDGAFRISNRVRETRFLPTASTDYPYALSGRRLISLNLLSALEEIE